MDGPGDGAYVLATLRGTGHTGGIRIVARTVGGGTVIDPVALAAELIRIPSESGDVSGMRAVQERVVAAIREHAPTATVRSGGDHLPWTLVSVGPGTLPGVMLACHTDTVPSGDPDAWQGSPIDGAITDGALHGRGAVDMKGALAAGAAAIVRSAAQGHPAHLLMTADEEVGSLGAVPAGEAAAALPLRGVIIPEATDLTVRCGHRGAAWLRLIAHGRAAHGSAPDRGINAVMRLAEALRTGLATFPARSDDMLGTETASVGRFLGGTATNIVPDCAHADLDQRTIADATVLVEHWRRLDGIDNIETILDLPPLRTDPAARFVTSLPAETDRAPVTYFTDGSVLAHRLGDVPIVVWGPGSPSQMHSVDETVPVDQLERAADLFAQAIAAPS